MTTDTKAAPAAEPFWFVYVIEEGAILYECGTDGRTGMLTPYAHKARAFGCAWVPAEPTPEMPNRKERYVALAELRAEEIGGHYCHARPEVLEALHAAGPRIGDRVRVKGTRSDGFVYGTGTVVDYVRSLPHLLTHAVELDHPPAAAAPDEFGNVFPMSPDELRTMYCRAAELEVL